MVSRRRVETARVGQLGADVDPQQALHLLEGEPADASGRRQLEQVGNHPL